MEIIGGERVPWEDLSDSESESSEDLPALPDAEKNSTELQQLVSSMAELITCLMRLSMAIRNPAPHDQFKESTHLSTSYFEPVDIDHVRGKFPSAKEYLILRLGKAISRRRQYLKYRASHRRKLEHGLEHVHAPSGTFESTVASSLPPRLKTSSTALELDNNTYYEDTLSETSYASSSNDPMKLRPPPLPEEGQYGQHFECPLCLRFTAVRQDSAWQYVILILDSPFH